MDAYHRQLNTLCEILEQYIDIFVDASEEPENAYGRAFFQWFLADVRMRVHAAYTFHQLEDYIQSLYTVCCACDLTLSNERKEAWEGFCTLVWYARAQGTEDFELAPLETLVRQKYET